VTTAPQLNSRYLPPGWDAPAVDCIAITTSADAQPAQLRGIYVGGAGNVVITTPGGNTVTFTAVPVGTQLWAMATHVTTASTATLMVGLL